MIEAIILSNQTLDVIDQWQQAIWDTGYGLDLNTAIPLESLDGYVPAKWRKSPSDRSAMSCGFECRHVSVEKALSGRVFQRPDAVYLYAFVLGWSEEWLAKFAVRIAAAAYASSTKGVILLKNRAPCEPESVLKDLRTADEYDQLPKLTVPWPTTSEKSKLYRFDERPKTIIRNAGSTKLHELKRAEYAVLVGRNNSGKSFVLKALTEHWGKDASYLGPARYQNFNLLTHYTPTEDKQHQRWKSFTSQWADKSQNFDNSPLSLQQAIAELSDRQRSDLKEIVKALLGVELEFQFTLPNNDMSQKYVSCNDHNISFTSSGLRLIITIITSLLDDSYNTVLIDEPELGISPEAQGVLADFLLSREHRRQYFSHIETLILATHSTVFLDRQKIRNNFVVEKSGDAISIRQIEDQRDFNRIHFFLLGNRFETLYLPSTILLVEGKTDHMFIERALAVRYPGSQMSVIAANTDSQIKHYLHITRGVLNGIQRSPYHDRIFVVLDARHGAGLAAEIVAMGIPQENIIEWTKNGIEYIYPESIVDAIFGEGPELHISGDVVSRNGISLRKNELAEKVCGLMCAETEMTSEFREKLLDRLDLILR